MSDWTPRARDTSADPAQEAAREAQHQVLIELLAGYADHELPPETASQIDAHLVGCARCRRELSIHQAVRRRLGVEPPVAAPPALRERIAAAIAATPVPEPPSAAPVAPPAQPWWRRRVAMLALAVVVVAGLAIAGDAVRRERAAAPSLGTLAGSPGAVPLLRAILDDYGRVTAGDLPGRARDLDAVRGAVAFPVEALRAPGLRLLAAWTTSLDGEAAAVLAYRWNDRVVLEYLVPDALFFQDSAVRGAVTDGRALAAQSGARGIIAWPTQRAGVIVVGELPTAALATIVSPELLARRTARVTE